MAKTAAFLMLILLVTVAAFVGGHGHSHSDEGEKPSFKYSREANFVEDEIMEDDIVDLPPQYSNEKPVRRGQNSHHDHHHGHSHGGHGHSHGGHGHSHGGHGHSHGGHGHSHGGQKEENLTPEERERRRERLHRIWDDDEEEEGAGGLLSSVWFQALGATFLISIFPFVILFFFDLDNSEEKRGLLKVLLSFASGGLLGDAFLHLIPHAIMAQEGHGHSHGDGGHGHSHEAHGHSHGGGGEGHSHDMTVGLGVLVGIIAFLVVEKLQRLFIGEGGHGHSHGGPPQVPAKAEKKDDGKKKKEKAKSSDDEEDEKEEDGEVSRKSSTGASTKDGAEPKDEEETEGKEEVRVSGYLNLFADAFHNFTDGLAIGASFLAGKNIGLMTTVTILFHEIPHEIGDYAILIQSGMRPFKAKCMQLLTAIGALTGCGLALFAGQGAGLEAANLYILPFTAGGFIYIATVSVLPELLEGATLKQSAMEILALVVGIASMVLIAQYE